MLFYLTHPSSSRSIKHNDIQIGQPGLQVRTSSRKQEGPIAWGPVLKNGNPFHGLVPYPKACTLHRPVTGTLVLRTISLAGPTSWGPELEKRHLSPGVAQSRVVAQPGPVTWACMLHHSMAGVLVPRTTIQGVRTHNLAPPD
jgi:hypothetical protein